MYGWWTTLAPGAKPALLAGILAVLLAFGTSAWWLLRTEHAVLFADLRPQDAALITAELEKLKVAYALADNGSTLLVDRSQVHAVRLKLMGRELPLHGTVGLELFNHTDFGMTEFAQKINYQRALQGELTRTILSFPEIRDARVHLALPEQGLFKQNATRPKAAVTLGMRQGRGLRPEQVSGIQRLVAAAVPGLVAQEVTVVDQQGITLTRPVEDEGSAGLDLKRELENYLSRKAGRVLDQAFGPGQALASVDVTLNMDHVRVTTEDVIGASDGNGGMATGVLVRERESARDTAAPEARTDARSARGSSMQRDLEYQTGRRVEQVVSQPGAIRRLQVVAVVRQDLPEVQRDQVHRMIAAAVGVSNERGDTVVVQALHAPPPPSLPAEPLPQEAPREMVVQPAWMTSAQSGFAALALLLGSGGAALVLLRRRVAMRPAGLSARQREAALQRVQGWLLEAGPSPVAEARQAPTGSAR